VGENPTHDRYCVREGVPKRALLSGTKVRHFTVLVGEGRTHTQASKSPQRKPGDLLKLRKRFAVAEPCRCE